MPSTKRGWIAYLDAYGVSPQVTSDPEDVSRRLLAVHQRLRKVAELRGTEIFMLSDSIFLFGKDDDDSVRQLRTFATAIKSVISVGIEHTLIFRGALAHGQVHLDRDLCVGASLVRAVRLESQLGFPFVVVPKVELEQAGIGAAALGWGACHEIELKDGATEGYPLLPDDLAKFAIEVEAMRSRALRDGRNDVVKTLGEFRDWLKSRRKDAARSMSQLSRG